MTRKTRTAALALTGIVALGGVAACGGNSSGGASAASQNKPAKPVAQLNNLSGVHTQVTLDSGFVNATKMLKLKLGTVGSAQFDQGTGTLTFPITGGNATYYTPGSRTPYVTGSIMHQGSGISLTAGGTTVKLTNFVVDPGKSVLTGDVSAGGQTMSNVDLFFLNGSTLQPLSKNAAGNEGILQGTKVYLTTDAANLLTQTYKLPAGTLSNQTLIGVAKITLALS